MIFSKEIREALTGHSPISYGLIAGLAGALIVLTLLVRRWLLLDSRRSGPPPAS